MLITAPGNMIELTEDWHLTIPCTEDNLPFIQGFLKDPQTAQTWNRYQEPRQYHRNSSAVVLPAGTALIVGGTPKKRSCLTVLLTLARYVADPSVQGLSFWTTPEQIQGLQAKIQDPGPFPFGMGTRQHYRGLKWGTKQETTRFNKLYEKANLQVNEFLGKCLYEVVQYTVVPQWSKETNIMGLLGTPNQDRAYLIANSFNLQIDLDRHHFSTHVCGGVNYSLYRGGDRYLESYRQPVPTTGVSIEVTDSLYRRLVRLASTKQEFQEIISQEDLQVQIWDLLPGASLETKWGQPVYQIQDDQYLGYPSREVPQEEFLRIPVIAALPKAQVLTQDPEDHLRYL